MRLVNLTAGSPYYNPHVQRPALFPPSDGYEPPEDPLVGVARQVAVTAALKRARLPSSSWARRLQLPPGMAAGRRAGGGRRKAAPTSSASGGWSCPIRACPADVLAGRPLRRTLLCRTFSDCTTAPRSGLVSGCYPLDAFYKEHPQRVESTCVKRAARG